MAAEYALYLVFVFAGTLGLKKAFSISLDAKRAMMAIVPVATVFIAWDVLAVNAGHWSFNPVFLLGLFVGNQPVEELAFFFVVPLFYLTVWEVAKTRLNGQERNDQRRRNVAQRARGGRAA